MTWQEYERELAKKGLKQKDRDFMERIFEFAQKIHEGEHRLSGEEYITHPAAVSLKLADLKLDTASIAAGLLHDAAERDPACLKTIRKEFGDEIAFLVNAVTKVDKISARGFERALESVRKMFLAVAQDIRVVMIKLMDREHNMETLEALSKEKQDRIALETLNLYAPLAERLGMWNVKGELEDLAFKYLKPKEYKEMKEIVDKEAPGREKQLQKAVHIVEDELKKENIKVKEISYRTKHLYSTWQKLERYEGDWSSLSDLIAIRIIVADVKDCYGALGVIHKIWKPAPGRFKDYIALPKPNGYQSLHTAVFEDKKLLVEFQIRTEAMHQEAEYGIAAHWAYSEAGKPKSGFKVVGKKFNWINQLSSWHKEFKKNSLSSEEMFEALKIDFFKDRIFVLTPKGDVIDLPEGATALDFAYNIHSEIGNRASGAKANGRLIPFSRELRSGEIIEILTQKNKKPSPEWLNFIKTGIAKNKIRQALRISPSDSFLSSKERPIEIRIYGKNRVGFIKDITNIFAKLHTNIQTLNANRAGNEEAPVRVTFVPKHKNDLVKIEERLKKIPDVKEVVLRPK